MAELRARAVEQQREKQERKIAAELEARKLKMRERGLHFVPAHRHSRRHRPDLLGGCCCRRGCL